MTKLFDYRYRYIFSNPFLPGTIQRNRIKYRRTIIVNIDPFTSTSTSTSTTTTMTDTSSLVTTTMTPTPTTDTDTDTDMDMDKDKDKDMTMAATKITSMNTIKERRKLEFEFEGWSREQLVQRLITLESQNMKMNTNTTSKSSNHSTKQSSSSSSSSSSQKLTQTQTQTQIPPTPTPTPIPKSSKNKKQKEFDFTKHPTRKIALKFCYSGWEYCGLAFQRNHDTKINLPTVEGVIWEAMKKARLVDPSSGEDLDKCGWEKCGRTDSGVSAAGQVVSLWIRSALSEEERNRVKKDNNVEKGEEIENDKVEEKEKEDESLDVTLPLSKKKTQIEQGKELDYVAILNRLLPPTIRILAWSPVSKDFSARFSCKYRHYKYFFSNHGLNISRMQKASQRLLGEHDFRNLCKVDPGKQITRFKRVISRADISMIDKDIDGEERGEKMFVFDLIGSAFLYHQVRHIMAILFVIGTGLEDPKLVTQLMNVTQSAESNDREEEEEEKEMEILDRKPEYQMVDGLPLMLWDCGYDEKDVNWKTSNLDPSSSSFEIQINEDGRRNGAGTDTDLYHQLHSIWNRSRIYTILDRHFLQAAEKYHAPPYSPLPLSSTSSKSTSIIVEQLDIPVNYPLGGGMYKRAVKYLPMLKRNRLDTVDVINERWRLGKGSRKMEKRNGNGNGDGDGEEGEGEE